MIITKECKLKNEDINLFEFAIKIAMVCFTTWLIEINVGIKRLYIMPFVFIFYIVLFAIFKNTSKE